MLFFPPVTGKGRWYSGRSYTAGQNTELAELKGAARTKLPLKTLKGFQGWPEANAVHSWYVGCMWCDCLLTLKKTCSHAALPSSVRLFWLLQRTGMREQKWVKEGVRKHRREKESAYYWFVIGYGKSVPSFCVPRLQPISCLNNNLGLWMKRIAREQDRSSLSQSMRCAG